MRQGSARRPASRQRDAQDIERDLTADRVSQAVVGKLLLEELDELGADFVLLFSMRPW